MATQSLEEMILRSVEVRLGKHFQSVIKPEKEGGKYRQLVTALIMSNDRFSVMDYLKKQKETTANVFPFLGFSLDSLSINRQNTARNIGAHYRAGEYTKNPNDNLFAICRSLPVEFNCNLIFLTDDFWQSLSFSAQLLIATVDRSILDFLCVFNGIPFSIKIEMSEDVTFPPKDNSLDIANFFEFNTTFKIQAYVSGDADFKNWETKAEIQKIVISPALVSGHAHGLDFLTEDNAPENFYISDGKGGYEQVIIEI